MVKFGKNKFKALNKQVKNQKRDSSNVSNKIIRKKHNAEKKIAFQKEGFLKEVISGNNSLVKNVSTTEIVVNDLAKKEKNAKVVKIQEPIKAPKIKVVEKQKKRHKTQISDTKLLLKLMKKK